MTTEAKATSKKEVYNALAGFDRRQIRNEMNEVIKNNRKCSLKHAQEVKRLRPSEVEEILKRFQ